jgi:1-acyl-sn-glycerol-3-phosphate acyltransferase
LAWFAILLLPSVQLRWRVIRALLRIGVRAAGIRISVQGSEHLLSSKPSVLVSNHTSYLDAFVLTEAVPVRYSFVAKSELKEQFVTGLPLRRLETEFVERYNVQRSAEYAKHLTRTIQAGRTLLFFPEGTFTRAPGLQPFRMGAFIAAAEAGVPVVPIAIRGTRSILRSDSWFPRRGRVSITVCEAIPPAAPHNADDAWGAAVVMRDTARDCILRHCGEVDLENPSVVGEAKVERQDI